jgi:flagellar motility protein MotE (MotC chaperone)
MCEKCAKLDRKIEHYERIRSLIGDQLTVDRIKELVVKMKADKAELHPAGE